MPTHLEASFKPHDLIYGLEKSRKPAREYLANKHPGHYFTVDPLNNIFFHDDAYHFDEARMLDKLNHDITLSQAQRAQIQSHFTALTQASYEKLRPSNQVFKQNDKSLDKQQRQVRRACKARLLDSTTQIHFILGEIEPREVFDRAYSNEHANQTYKEYKSHYESYTSAELRFVLKHYGEIKNHVVFYRSNYEAVDLFAWLQEKIANDGPTKTALQQWLAIRVEQNKIDLEAVKKLNEVLLNTASVSSLPVFSSEEKIPSNSSDHDKAEAYSPEKPSKSAITGVLKLPPTPAPRPRKKGSAVKLLAFFKPQEPEEKGSASDSRQAQASLLSDLPLFFSLKKIKVSANPKHKAVPSMLAYSSESELSFCLSPSNEPFEDREDFSPRKSGKTSQFSTS